MGKLKYIGIALLPISLLIFALQYTGRDKYITKRNIILISIIPILALVLLWTNSYHHLYYKAITIEELGAISYFSSNFGPFFWIIPIYSYLLSVTGVILILDALSNLHRHYWKQAVVIAVGVLVPLLGNILYISGPSPELDITPILFLPASISLAFGVRKFQFLNAFLIGRKTVFEKINDAIFVLDTEKRIIDLNREGELLVKELGYRKGIMEKAEDIFSEKFNLKELDNFDNEKSFEFKLEKSGNERYFQTKINSLRKGREKPIGWTIIVKDFTERKRTEERKRFLNTLLRQDLRSKCQTNLVYLQLLEELNLSKEHKKYLSRAIKAGKEENELLGLAEELREIEETEWYIEKDIVKIIEKVARDISHSVEEEGVEIEVNSSKSTGKVKDNYSLNTILSQIIEIRSQDLDCNKIKINFEERKENIYLKIEDNGKKLPGDIKNLFSGDIYTGKTSGANGVRYYIIEELAKQNNTKIEIKDSDLGGAKFDVFLRKA